MTEVEVGIYTHRWSPLQVRAVESVALHTRGLQYSVLVQQSPGTCARNMNRLWDRFRAPYAVLLDEDVAVLQDGWLEALLEVLEVSPLAGVVGCPATRDESSLVAEPSGQVPVLALPWIPAYVMAFRRDRVPFLRFDEEIPGDMGMTDVDACLQLAARGLLSLERTDVLVYHPARDDDETRAAEGRPTVARQRAWYPDQAAYMRRKWGGIFDELVSGKGRPGGGDSGGRSSP